MNRIIVSVKPFSPHGLAAVVAALYEKIVLEGRYENSPGWSPRQRTEPWECVPNMPTPSRRDGRNLPPNISRIVFDLMFLEKRDVLGLEVAFSVMLFLARDVRERSAYLSPSDGERAIPFLPFKFIQAANIMHPERGCALNVPHCRGNRRGRRQREQYVNVVLHAADTERLHVMFASDAAHVSPKARLDFGDNDFGRSLVEKTQ